MSRNKRPVKRGPLSEMMVDLGGCFASGGHSGDPRDLWRREEEDEHRHGAHYWALGALSGWANHRVGRQHRQLCPVAAKKVPKNLFFVKSWATNWIFLQWKSYSIYLMFFIDATRMAIQGRTIIMSIHQPRYSIYRLFDTLTLLVSGKMVYHGPAPNALDYFANIGDCAGLQKDFKSFPGRFPNAHAGIILVCVLGYLCEPHNNPADFFLDVINGDSTTTAMSKASEGSSINTVNHHYSIFFINVEQFTFVSSVHLSVVPQFIIFTYVWFRFRLWGAERFQAEDRGASGGGVQEQQLCQQYQGRAQPHPPTKGVFHVHKVPDHHLQQSLLPPAPLGASENLPEPHAEPTNISGPGDSQLMFRFRKNRLTKPMQAGRVEQAQTGHLSSLSALILRSAGLASFFGFISFIFSPMSPMAT